MHPGDAGNQQAGEDSRRAHVLGARGERVRCVADTVNRRLDGGIKKFSQEYNQAADDQQHLLHRSCANPECQGDQYQAEERFLAEGGFVLPGGLEAGK